MSTGPGLAAPSSGAFQAEGGKNHPEGVFMTLFGGLAHELDPADTQFIGVSRHSLDLSNEADGVVGHGVSQRTITVLTGNHPFLAKAGVVPFPGMPAFAATSTTFSGDPNDGLPVGLVSGPDRRPGKWILSIERTTTGSLASTPSVGNVNMIIPPFVSQFDLDMTGSVTDSLGAPVTSPAKVEVTALLDLSGLFQENDTGNLLVIAPATPGIRLQVSPNVLTIGGGLSKVVLSTDATGAFAVRLGGLGGAGGSAGAVQIKAELYPAEGKSGGSVIWTSPVLAVRWAN